MSDESLPEGTIVYPPYDINNPYTNLQGFDGITAEQYTELRIQLSLSKFTNLDTEQLKDLVIEILNRQNIELREDQVNDLISRTDFSTIPEIPEPEPEPEPEPVLTPAEISAQHCTYINNIQLVPTELNENEIQIEPIVFEQHIAMEQLENAEIEGLSHKYSVYRNPAMNLLSKPFITSEHINEDIELSTRTSEIIKTQLNSILAKKNKINVVEIGVCAVKNNDTINNSTTGLFITNKRKQDFYIGIDIIRRNTWDDNENNVYTIHSPSEYFDENINKLNEMGVNEIDILMIDGWHSMEQLYKEWQYTRILSSVGVVIINSVNLYPGPYYICKSIDDTKYHIYRYLSDVKDNGICVAVRK
jgi:hypothetical protein